MNNLDHKKLRHFFLTIILIILVFSILHYFYNKIRYGVNSKELFSSTLIQPEKRRILILYTGGTIGMVESDKGNVPKKGYLKQQLNKISELENKISELKNQTNNKFMRDKNTQFDPIPSGPVKKKIVRNAARNAAKKATKTIKELVKNKAIV